MDLTDHMGLFYEPGTGKTAIALTWIRNALRDGRIEDALIIVPASLIANWEKDIRELTDFDHITEDDVRLLQERVTIRSYQKIYRSSKDSATNRRRIALREDVDKLWGVIIVDESQGLGGHSSIQTKACLTLAPLAKYRYIMTGTPISGSTKGDGEDLSKLYGQLKFLDPSLWKNWTEWCKKYVLAVDRFYKPIKFDTPALHKLMSEMAISVRLEDCVDLPGEIRTIVPCPLEEQKAYKEILSGKAEPYGFRIRVAGGQFTKLLQLCSGSLKKDDGTVAQYRTSKDEVFTTLLEDNPGPIVVFCKYTASIDRCYELAKKAGRDPVIFDGRSKGPTWMPFQTGEKDVLVLQYVKGSKGLNVQNSNVEILYEPCFSSDNLKQAFARIQRTGQKNICRYFLLSTPKTREQDAWDSVLNGKDVTAETFRRWAEEGSI